MSAKAWCVKPCSAWIALNIPFSFKFLATFSSITHKHWWRFNASARLFWMRGSCQNGRICEAVWSKYKLVFSLLPYRLLSTRLKFCINYNSHSIRLVLQSKRLSHQPPSIVCASPMFPKSGLSFIENKATVFMYSSLPGLFIIVTLLLTVGPTMSTAVTYDCITANETCYSQADPTCKNFMTVLYRVCGQRGEWNANV